MVLLINKLMVAEKAKNDNKDIINNGNSKIRITKLNFQAVEKDKTKRKSKTTPKISKSDSSSDTNIIAPNNICYEQETPEIPQ